MEVIDSEFSRQYQAKINGELAFVDYAIQERKIFFTKTLLPEATDEVLIDEFFKGVFSAGSPEKNIGLCPCVLWLLLFSNAIRNIKMYYPLASEYKVVNH